MLKLKSTALKRTLLLLIIICFSISARAQWASQTTGQVSNSQVLSISPVNNNVVWAITSANELLRTTNGGATWTVSSLIAATGFPMIEVNCITALDASTAWITTVEAGFPSASISGVFKTTDGGQTWTQQTIGYNGNSWPNMIHFFNSNDGVTMGDTNGGYFEIYTTSNGGSTWSRVPLSNLPAPDGNNDVGTGGDLYAVSGNTIWISVLGMRVLKSNDKGLHWTVANTGLTQAGPNNLPLGLAFSDINNGLVLANSQLKRTTDGGQTWTTVNYTGPVKFYLSNVPGATNTYISTGPGGTRPVGSSYSNDGGNTWISLENTIQHRLPRFYSPTSGWTGGVNTLYKFSSTVLGLNDFSRVNSFFISPNPSTGVFTITNPTNQPFRLEVFSSFGVSVLQQQGSRFGSTRLDLTAQPKGMYLVRIYSRGQIITKRIIIQ
ncbi:T9SS type A sorting domain-containing protein [Adhaeribacter soli]|nr:T9SS type A sorting domain-containing protein [Adhaeribacter soli]